MKGRTIMKKKMIFICGIVVCISLIGVGVYASMQMEKSSVQSATEAGAAVKTAAIALKNSDSSGIFETDSKRKQEDVVMTIMGKSVSKVYFDYRASLYSACDNSNPVKDAEDLMKKQAVQWSFAEEHGLLPSEQEIMEYCNSMREAANSDPENREIMSAIVQSMGLTEAEYFEIIQPKYEVPYILIEQNISEYCEENGVDKPAWENAELNIKDENYMKKIEAKYNVS